MLIGIGGILMLLFGDLMPAFEHSVNFTISGVKINLMPLYAPVVKQITMGCWFCLFYLIWNGNTDFIRTYMSNRLYQALSTMAFSSFMTHFLVIWYSNATRRQPRNYHIYSHCLEGLGTYCITQVLGYLMYIVIEAPFGQLLKTLLKK